MNLRNLFNISRSQSNNKMHLEEKEIIRLRKVARYKKVETKLYGVKLSANDACTLLIDVSSILQKGIYEFITDTEDPLIIDCGANIGISVIYFKKLYPRSKILAFEPDPLLFNHLEQNISNFKFSDVNLINKAIWIDDNGVTFKSEGGHSGKIVQKINFDDNTLKIASVSLKDLLRSYNKVNFLKIDIEGAENEVILSCGDELKKCENIFVEYHSRNDTKQKLQDILTLFSSLDFRYHITEAFSRKKPFIDRNCMLDMDLQLNLFFWK